MALLHEPFLKLEDNLWTVAGPIPGPLPLGGRRMAIARLSDGRLVLQNGMMLQDAALRELESFGEPAFLLVPNGFHRLEIAALKARYPRLRVVCGAGSRERVGKAVPVDGGWELVPAELRVELIPLRENRAGECVVRVQGKFGATSLSFFGDTLMNIPRTGGIKGRLARLLGYPPGPRVTWLARKFVVGDVETLRAQLRELAATPGLARVIPCHGAIVEDDPAGVPRAVAQAL